MYLATTGFRVIQCSSHQQHPGQLPTSSNKGSSRCRVSPATDGREIMKVSGPRPVQSKRNCDQLIDQHGTGVGGQSNFALAKQPQLNNQDLKNPNPQNHSQPVKSLRDFPFATANMASRLASETTMPTRRWSTSSSTPGTEESRNPDIKKAKQMA